jgi:hypothetical protein
MERYNRNREVLGGLTEDENGEFVRWEDAEAEIKKHEAVENRIMDLLEIRCDIASFEGLRLGDVREVVDLIRNRRAGKE